MGATLSNETPKTPDFGAVVVALSPEGHRLWGVRFGQAGYFIHQMVATGADLFVGGRTGRDKGFVAKLRNGEVLWNRVFKSHNGAESLKFTGKELIAQGGRILEGSKDPFIRFAKGIDAENGSEKWDVEEQGPEPLQRDEIAGSEKLLHWKGKKGIHVYKNRKLLKTIAVPPAHSSRIGIRPDGSALVSVFDKQTESVSLVSAQGKVRKLSSGVRGRITALSDGWLAIEEVKSEKFILTKVDPSGAIEWTRTYKMPGPFLAYAASEFGDGRFALSLISFDPTHALVALFNNDGTQTAGRPWTPESETPKVDPKTSEQKLLGSISANGGCEQWEIYGPPQVEPFRATAIPILALLAKKSESLDNIYDVRSGEKDFQYDASSLREAVLPLLKNSGMDSEIAEAASDVLTKTRQLGSKSARHPLEPINISSRNLARLLEAKWKVAIKADFGGGAGCH